MSELKRFTDSYIKSLKPPEKGQYEKSDPAFPNFGIRVSEGGRKSWVAYYRWHGVQKRVTLGRYGVGGLSLKDARFKAQKVHGQVARGKNPLNKEEERKFPDFAEEFIVRYAKPNTRSWKMTQRALENEFISNWKNRSLTSITKADVRVIIDHIVDRGSASAAIRILAIIRKFFNWCIERGYLEHSPCAGLKPPRKQIARDRVLSDDELARVWRAAEEIGYPYPQMIRLLMLTGQRKGEIKGMRWNELMIYDRDGKQLEMPVADMSIVNAGNSMWDLRAERTKANRAHTIPLVESTLEIIGTSPWIGSDFVFPARGGLPQGWDGFNKAKVKLDQIAGINEHWVVHDLRRTFATGCARLGAQPHVIERILNHATGQISGVAAVYNRHTYLDEMRDALEKWAAHVSRLVI